MIEKNHAHFADSDYHAYQKAKRFGDEDPFPSILPSLLNSADIEDYLRATGMVYPILDNKKQKPNLKSASFQCRVGKKIHFWPGGESAKRAYDIEKNETFEISANSIVFIETHEFFRLPKYIAMRFNLQINLVHRGFLLGTGPLVDPGFVGRLLVPVHNLTATNHTISHKESFIWAEFTKTSPISGVSRFDEDQLERCGRYVPFPESKMGRTADEYLADANKRNPIVSSIPEAVQHSAKRAEEAEREASKAKKEAERSRNLSFGITIGTIVGILALWATFYDAVTNLAS